MSETTHRLYDATWGRLFAATYNGLMSGTEKKGMADRRAGLIAKASGRTLELGAGTGLNLEHYPEAVTELVLTEPFGPMAKRLRERLAEDGRSATVIEAPAESLPFDDASFDTVVVTLVLCTVDDVPATLAEIARVLSPGGRLLFCEHVRSADPGAARWQDRLERPWRFLGHGCRCNRDTVAAIDRSALDLEDVRAEELEESPPIVRPLAIGSAVKTA